MRIGHRKATARRIRQDRTKSDDSGNLAFRGKIGKNGEPAELALMIELSRDYWQIWPKSIVVDATSGKSIAENNVRTALILINSVDDDDKTDHERLLLEVLDRGIDFLGRDGCCGGSAKSSQADELVDIKPDEYSSPILAIYNLAERLTSVRRKIMLLSSRWENDSEHTLATALIAWQVARRYAPELDAGEVLKMALVHELTEVITGDVATYGLNTEQLKNKKRQDERAVRQFAKDFSQCTRLVQELEKYESKKSPEARFVYWIDKVMPGPTNYDPSALAYWMASKYEILEAEGLGFCGQNGNHETLACWYEATRSKLLAAGDVPNNICEELLEQNLWLQKWLIDTQKR